MSRIKARLISLRAVVSDMATGFFVKAVAFLNRVGVSDRIKKMSKNKLRSVAFVSDSISAFFGRQLRNVALVSDRQYLDAEKLERSDAVITDSHSIGQEATKGDSASAADAHVYAFSKFLYDNIIATEDVDGSIVGDDNEIIINKGLQSLALISDVHEMLSSKRFSDSASALDSGRVLGQNYCHISYFDDDYIGFKINF